MTEWSEGLVAANGLQVFYHSSEPDAEKPSILLLHGFTDNGLCWSRVARELEKNYNIIMTDARGHGRTEGPVEEMGAHELADDAAAVIQALGLEKPFLFGHSMGAMTAVAVAAQYPALVRAIVLEDPPFRDFQPVTPEQERQLQEAAKDNLAFKALPLEDRIASGKAQNPNWSDDEILPWAESKGEYKPELMERRKGLRGFNWREAIGQVQCPALLITAEVQKGAIVTPEAAQEATELCHSCETVFVKEAGHSIHRDRFNETMALAREFLSKH